MSRRSLQNASGGIMGVGNPLLDLNVMVEPELLARYELEPGAVVLAEERHMALYDELHDEHDVEYVAAGATQSSIRVAAWMLSNIHKRKRPRCAFVGCVGNDGYGQRLAEACAACEIEAHYRIDAELPTGTTAVLISKTNGERTMVANLAAASKYTLEHLQSERTTAMLREASIVYSAGFILASGGVECARALGETCAAAARKGDAKRFCLNLSAPFLCEFFTDQILAVLPFVDLLFANETEARALAAKTGFGDDLDSVALALSALPKNCGCRARVVVITQGAEPTLVAVDGEVRRFLVAPLARESVVDLNGAGDAFVGGFLSQLVLDKPLADAVNAGHWAARVVVQRAGSSLPEQCDYS